MYCLWFSFKVALRNFLSTLFFVLLVSTSTAETSSNTSLPPALMTGIDQFSEEFFNAAILSFRSVILDSRLSRFHGDAFFWVGKSYLAAKQYNDAEQSFAFVLDQFPDNNNIAETRYHYGRLFYLLNNPERSIQELAAFIKNYPSSPYVPNSYYWIGESLFSLGEYDTAKSMFEKVTVEYPKSYKVEAARYRASIVNFRQRETELLRLLKLSHEDTLGWAEEFQEKERAYESEILSLKRQISDVQTENVSELIEAKNLEIEKLQDELSASLSESGGTSAQLTEAQNVRREMQNQLLSKTVELESLKAALATSQADLQEVKTNLAAAEAKVLAGAGTRLERDLLNLKQEALRLQEELLRNLSERVGVSS